MKQLLMLPLLLLGLSFACDQPHEEISFFKVGCPFTGDKNALKQHAELKDRQFQELILQGSFFETAKIDVLDGNIEGVSFSKDYRGHGVVGKDFDALLVVLKEKWGDVEDISIEGTLKAFKIEAPNSDILDNIFIFDLYDYSGGSINVSYSSKKLIDHGNKLREEDKKQRMKKFDDF